MPPSDTSTVEVDQESLPTQPSGGGSGGGGWSSGGASGGGRFQHYKPEQGKWTRGGTFVGIGLLVGWGAFFLNNRLSVFQGGDEAWRLIITPGIPIFLAVVLGALGWWVSYSSRKSSDFMIATEGEMKKVNWSTRREIIGSTKVVIFFTILMALFLFIVDLAFQQLFSVIGVLKS